MKKAYIIPLVILLLFVSVVPSFAVETELPDYQVYLTQFYRGATLNGGATWLPDRGPGQLYIHIPDNPMTYAGLEFSKYSMPLNQTYTIYFHAWATVNAIIQFAFYSTSHGYWKYQNVSVTTERAFYSFEVSLTDKPVNYLWLFHNGLPGGEDLYIDYFNIVSSSSGSPLSYISDNDRILVSGNYQIPGFFDPVLDTYSHLFDPFVHVSENFSTYSVFFTFAGIILSVLILIFITVFIIKRFTGGNS